MSTRPAALEIILPAEAANVSLIRHAIAGLAESTGMDEELVGDVKTVITEACMNVVVHAYPGGEGLLWVRATPEEGSLLLEVSDEGAGIQPRVDAEESDSSLRLGFSLIAAICSSFEIAGGRGRGTRIEMRLPLSRRPEPRPQEAERGSAGEPVAGEVRIVAGVPELLPVVLSRALSAFGSGRDLSVDQLSDAMLLADAVSADAPASFDGDPVSLSLRDGDGGIDLRVGPLQPGAGARLRESLALPAVGGSIETLADKVLLESGEEGEFVVFRIAPLPVRST